MSEIASAVVLHRMDSPRNAYVYAIVVDGVVRYIGKGNGKRLAEHRQIVARLIAGRPGGPKEQVVHRRLAAAVRTGAAFEMQKIAVGLTDADAFAAEAEQIAAYPKDQLWNLHEGGIGATSEFARAKWTDPDYRAKQEAAAKNPVVVERRRLSQIAAQNRPDVRERVKAAQRAAFALPAAKANRSAAMKVAWQNPEYRAAVVAGRKAQWTPEARAKQSEALRQFWSASEARRTQSERLTGVPKRKRASVA